MGRYKEPHGAPELDLTQNVFFFFKISSNKEIFQNFLHECTHMSPGLIQWYVFSVTSLHCSAVIQATCVPCVWGQVWSSQVYVGGFDAGFVSLFLLIKS